MAPVLKTGTGMLLAPSEATAAFPRLSRLGARRLTRAHALLAERPSFATAAKNALTASLSAVGAQLGSALQARAHLVDSAVNLSRALPRTSAYALVDLSALYATAVVDVEPVFLSAVLERLCGAKARKTPVSELTRIEQIAFGFLCTTALAGIRGHADIDGRFAPRLISVHQRREEVTPYLAIRERHVCVDLRLELGDLSGAVRLFLPARALQTALQELPAVRPSTFETAISTLGVPFRARMGRASLTLQEIVGLSRGDVVVFDGMVLAEGTVTGPVRLLGASFDLTGTVTQTGFQVSRAHLRGPRTELPMNGKDDATCMLPIELEVELARVQLPVSDLAAIKPGAVVPLRINAADPVVIRIGERTVARAELVEIDGEVGARILSLVG